MMDLQALARGGRLALLVTASLIAAPAAGSAQDAADANHFPANEDLETMLRYLVEDGQAGGIVFGILEADGSTRIVSHGDAGPGARPLGPRSVFEIGSMNKTFTGTLLAYAIAEGEVALSDPISKHLPANVETPHRNGKEITLLDLATHYSGLPRNPDNLDPVDPRNRYADYTVERLYTFLSNHQLRREPGAEGEYSNLGMGLLGHILGLAAGVDFKTLVQERILDPLGMTMTSYSREGALAEWMTKGFGATGEIVPYYDVDVLAGAGGLNSNLEDLLKYLQANIGPADTDLGRAMRAAHQIQRPVQGNLSIGFGWQVVEEDGQTIVMHGGGTGGFRTLLAFDPDQRVGFVRLTNSLQFDDDIDMDFLRRGPPLDIPEVEVGREILATYAGEYRAAPGRSILVQLEDDGTLTMRAPGNVRFQMYAESETEFFVKRAPWRVSFTLQAGEVVGLTFNGQRVPRAR